ncbi:MAG: P-type DNA transfer ATPase VirB11 [Alphaproteobacteria bacterium]
MTQAPYLDAYLAPLKTWLERPNVTDILVNRPGEVWVETTQGVMTREAAPDLTEVVLGRLARQVAAASHQGVSRERPLLSATLADGARIQVIAPPATRDGLVLAVRRQAIADLSLQDLGQAGLFSTVETATKNAGRDAQLQGLLDAKRYEDFLRAAVKARKSIVISGGAGAGKTTLLNALLKEISEDERLIAIEDAPEIRLHHDNALGLVAVRGDQGEARVTVDDLLGASLRMRPDRIILGELRGAEAFSFLRAVNSGHPGSLTTVHADSTSGALDQIALLALSSGLDLGWVHLQTYVRRIVDVVVQVEKSSTGRRISEIVFNPSGPVSSPS